MVFRVHKSKDYTIMSNYHFKDKKITLKAKGLLSLMLSSPDNWDYSIMGLTAICKESKDSIMNILNELEENGYIKRTQTINEKGQFSKTNYDVYENPNVDYPYKEDQ